MKVFSIIKNVLINALIIVLFSLIVFGFMNRVKPVPIFDYYFLTVKTGSMESTLNIGDNIIVKKVDSYKVGDIVTYKKDNIYVTHRIVKINENKITTRGDANNADDPIFNKKNIIGKFVYKSELLNFIIKYKLIIALVVIVIYLMHSIMESRKRKVI